MTTLARIGTVEFMTLKEITDLLEVRHNNAMITVAKMATDPGFGSLLKFSSQYTSGKNTVKAIQTYQLDKRQSIAVAARLNTSLLMKIIDRWQELELENARLKSQEQERVADRQAARLECHVMTDSIKEIRAEEGKKTSFYHYSNEMDMINRIVLGMTAKKYRLAHEINPIDAIRDRLSPFQIKMIQLLQATNTALIQCDISYKERNKKLGVLYEREAKKLAIK